MLETLAYFFERGGVVLYVIFIVAFVLSALLFERYFYLKSAFFKEGLFPSSKLSQLWFRQRVYEYCLSDAEQKLKKSTAFIRTLIVVCPLLGLLGTVTGMIEVFDVMALESTGNVRAMASGVSMATIPTMAGMVVALCGLLFEKQVSTSIKKAKAKYQKELEQRSAL